MSHRLRMTSIQEAYWVGRRPDTASGGVSTHTFEELDATGIDLDRLEASFNALILRHQMMRARITPSGEIEILDQVPWYHFGLDDVSDRPPIEQEIRLEAVRNRMREEVLAADAWPLYRVRAVRLSHGRLRIFTSMDALTLDARSRGVLYREWQTLYNNPKVELPPVQASFQEFVEELRNNETSESFDSARAYWSERLDTLPGAPRLHAARTQSSDGNFIRLAYDVDQSTLDRIEAMAEKMGCQVYVLLLAIFSQTVAQWSKDERFHVILTLFDRIGREERFASTLGDFTSTTLLDCSAPEESSLEELVQAIRSDQKKALTHAAYNGVMVARDAAQKDVPWPSDGVVTVFTNLLGPNQVKEWRSAWIGPALRMNSQTPQVGLDFQLWSLANGIRISWDFHTGMLDETTTRAMFADYTASVVASVAEPVENTIDVPAFPTKPAEDENRLLTDDLAWHIKHRDDSIAVLSANRAMTFGDLGTSAMGAAHALRKAIPEGEAPVLLALERSPDQVVGSIGIVLAGRAYVPVHPDWPEERIERIAASCGARSILTLSSFTPESETLNNLEQVHLDTIDPAPFEPETWRASADDIAYIIYTSGSTGEPKGVAMQHNATLATIDEINNRFMIDADDCAFGVSAMTFDLSVWDIFGMLGAGGRLVVADKEAAKDPGTWARLVRRHRVTVWNSVPTLAQLLAERIEEDGGDNLSTLRLFLLSGDWIPIPLPDRLRAIAPAADVTSLGGATEAAIWSVAYEIGHVDPNWRSIPYGRALAGQTIDVRNEQLEKLPIGEIGEIIIGGAGLALGYIGDTELTNNRFTLDPEGSRVYRTGDLGRLQADGNIEFLGRADNQVKIAGYRIELGDVEHALSAHPDVEACLVKAVGPPCGERRLFAYVVTNGNGSPGVDSLKAHVSGHLPEYMVPSVIRTLDRLPLTSNGKVDRNADLEEMSTEWGDDHTTVTGNTQSPTSPPVTATTNGNAPAADDQLVATVQELAREVLDLDDVTPATSLLDLGASSVDMIRIANRLEMLTGGIRPRLDDIYDAPSPIGIAALLEPLTTTNGTETASSAPGKLPAQSGSAVLAVPGANNNPILSTVLRNREEVLAFKKENHGRRNDLDDVPGVQLPDLHPTPDGIRPRTRKSRRLYSQNTLSLETIADLLHVLRADGTELRRFNYASSGPTYPISSYLLARPGRIEGLADATYWFDPDANRLVPVGGIGEFGPQAVWGDINKRMLESAAFGIALVSRHSSIVPVYDRASDRYALLETGFMSQLIEEQAERLNLGVCQVGALDSEVFHSAANLQEDDIVLNWIVGGERLQSEDDDIQITEELL